MSSPVMARNNSGFADTQDEGITNVGDAVEQFLDSAADPRCITGCFHHVAGIIRGTKHP